MDKDELNIYSELTSKLPDVNYKQLEEVYSYVLDLLSERDEEIKDLQYKLECTEDEIKVLNNDIRRYCP